MKKSFLFKMTILSGFLVSFLVIAGCSSWGGGDAAPGVTTSALTKTVALSGLTGEIDVPFANSDPGTDHRSMMLYTAAEVKGAGTITSISFRYFTDQPTAVSCPNTTIKMSHTNLTGLNTTYANNINTGQGSQQTVFTTGTVNIPAGTAGNYYTIPLTTPFNYNGQENLVVDIAHDVCSGSVQTINHFGTGALVTLENVGATATTGYARTWRPDTKFNLSGGDNTITYTVTSASSYPFDETSGRKIQLLYTAAEISGTGIITGIAFPVSGPTTATSAIVTVKLGHTSLSALTTTFAANFNSGTPVTVANAQTFTIPAGVPNGDYVWFPLPDGAFNYDGIHNLVVEIEVSALTGHTDWLHNSSSGTDTGIYGNFGALTGNLRNNQCLIKFRFAGGPVDVITPETTEQTSPFNDTQANKLQHLYRAAELGTKGTITKVAFRLSNADSNNTAYNSFAVVLGHSALIPPELGWIFSTNMVDAQTVFSGTFTVPAGLKIGDWIEIPLSTPFAYDGKRDLVVQVSSLQGAAENRIKMSLDPTRYKSRRAMTAASNTTDTVSSVMDDLADLRLIMQ